MLNLLSVVEYSTVKVGSTGFKFLACAREEAYEFVAISDKNSALVRNPPQSFLDLKLRYKRRG